MSEGVAIVRPRLRVPGAGTRSDAVLRTAYRRGPRLDAGSAHEPAERRRCVPRRGRMWVVRHARVRVGHWTVDRPHILPERARFSLNADDPRRRCQSRGPASGLRLDTAGNESGWSAPSSRRHRTPSLGIPKRSLTDGRLASDGRRLPVSRDFQSRSRRRAGSRRAPPDLTKARRPCHPKAGPDLVLPPERRTDRATTPPWCSRRTIVA